MTTVYALALSALSLMPLGAMVGMGVAEVYREQEAMWRFGDVEASPAFADLPHAKQWLTDPSPRIPVGEQQAETSGRHAGNDVAEPVPGHRPRHAQPGEDTVEFARIVGAGWTAVERASLSKEWWCEHCAEQTPVSHLLCSGCACPCTRQAAQVGDVT